MVDEADLLMSGGYEQDTAKILQSMKTADNVKKAEQISKALGISLEEFQTIPRLERGQALKGEIKTCPEVEAAERMWAIQVGMDLFKT